MCVNILCNVHRRRWAAGTCSCCSSSARCPMMRAAAAGRQRTTCRPACRSSRSSPFATRNVDSRDSSQTRLYFICSLMTLVCITKDYIKYLYTVHYTNIYYSTWFYLQSICCTSNFKAGVDWAWGDFIINGLSFAINLVEDLKIFKIQGTQENFLFQILLYLVILNIQITIKANCGATRQFLVFIISTHSFYCNN